MKHSIESRTFVSLGKPYRHEVTQVAKDGRHIKLAHMDFSCSALSATQRRELIKSIAPALERELYRLLGGYDGDRPFGDFIKGVKGI